MKVSYGSGEKQLLMGISEINGSSKPLLYFYPRLISMCFWDCALANVINYSQKKPLNTACKHVPALLAAMFPFNCYSKIACWHMQWTEVLFLSKYQYQKHQTWAYSRKIIFSEITLQQTILQNPIIHLNVFIIVWVCCWIFQHRLFKTWNGTLSTLCQ